MRAVIAILSLVVISFCACAQFSKVPEWKAIETEADTLMNREDAAGALKLYNKAIEMSKLASRDSKALLYKRAVCYYTMGEFQLALADVNSFITDVPYYPQSKLLRAFINRELQNDDAVLTDLNELLSLNPYNADLVKWKTSIYLNQDKFREVISALKELQKGVNDEEVEAQMGFSYYSLDNADSAFIHFENAMNINPGYLPAYLYMSSLCLEQEAYELALTYIDIGLRLESQNANLFLYKGVALAETNREEEGCRYLLKAFNAGLEQAGDYLKQYCYEPRN